MNERSYWPGMNGDYSPNFDDPMMGASPVMLHDTEYALLRDVEIDTFMGAPAYDSEIFQDSLPGSSASESDTVGSPMSPEQQKPMFSTVHTPISTRDHDFNSSFLTE